MARKKIELVPVGAPSGYEGCMYYVRLMAALSLILDIPLDKKVSKIIKFDVGN